MTPYNDPIMIPKRKPKHHKNRNHGKNKLSLTFQKKSEKNLTKISSKNFVVDIPKKIRKKFDQNFTEKKSEKISKCQ